MPCCCAITMSATCRNCAGRREAKRQLFVLPDGSPTAESYIPRVYKVLTGNSFGTVRTMLHTELASSLGPAGCAMAMAACHQTSEEVARQYQGEAVAIKQVERCQAAASARRARYIEAQRTRESHGRTEKPAGPLP